MRLLVQPEDLPLPLREALRGRKHRVAIHNAAIGGTRLECLTHCAILAILKWVDMGSIGFANALTLFYRWGVRGDVRCDPFRRRVRVRENALRKAGLLSIKTEYSLVLTFTNGPFLPRLELPTRPRSGRRDADVALF